MHTYNVVKSGLSIDKAKKALILLHGRGSSAYDILGLAKYFTNNTFYVAAPQAENGTWYPYSFMAEEQQNEPWLSSAVDVVKRLIDETSQKILLDHIYIMGFSQGACLTLEVTARYAKRYGGIAAFTGGLIGKTLNHEKYRGDFKGTPVFIGTGDRDPHIPLERSQASAKIMEDLGAQVELKVYQDMPHTINQDEVESVKYLLNL